MTSFSRTGLCAALMLSAAVMLLPQGRSQAQSSDAAPPALPQTMTAPKPNPEDPAPNPELKNEPAAEGADQQQELPVSPPRPQANPEEPVPETVPAPEPVPAPAPADVPGEPRKTTQPEEPQALPATPPEPDTRPKDAPDEDTPDTTAKKEEDAPARKRTSEPGPQQGPALPASLVGPQPASELACRAELKALGVEFKDREPESSEDGCSMPYPVSITNFGGGIKVEPAVVANCSVSLAMAKFLQGPVKDAAAKHLKTSITQMANGSGYVCRPRHGTQKLSEHALGNAIDIMSFTLSDDRSVVVEKSTDKAETDFLAEVREAACGPFTTVLGPGSDSDHANHFHLDLADRRPGVTFCQ